jgi:hypothetical protein
MCFSTQPNRDIWNEERLSPAGNLSCRKYCCQNITEFSQGNNVLHAVPSNTDGLFCNDICVSSTELNMPI